MYQSMKGEVERLKAWEEAEAETKMKEKLKEDSEGARGEGDGVKQGGGVKQYKVFTVDFWWRGYGKIILLLLINYVDFGFDIAMVKEYHDEGLDSYAVTAGIFIVVPLVLQFVGAKFFWRQSWWMAMGALVGLKPALDAWGMVKGETVSMS
jgi:hypothetical protein